MDYEERRYAKLLHKDLQRDINGTIHLIKDPIPGYPNKVTLMQIIGVDPLPDDSNEITITCWFPTTGNKATVPYSKIQIVQQRITLSVRSWNNLPASVHPTQYFHLEAHPHVD